MNKIFITTHKIIIPVKPTDTENFAAVELQKYLKIMSNIEVAIKNETGELNGIHIGNTKSAKLIKKQLSLQLLSLTRQSLQLYDRVFPSEHAELSRDTFGDCHRE